jgi:hypothetical protein
VILLNFSHPLTADHLAQIDAPAQFDVDASFVTQVGALVDGIGLSPAE